MNKQAVERIRSFNRFYLPKFGLLGNSYLGSEYSATQARVLYEVYMCDGCTASFIAKNMNIDKSYLSRIISSHIKKGYMYRTASSEDARTYHLHLTKSGKERTADFIEKSNREISAKTKFLSQSECSDLIKALDTVTLLLESQGGEKK